jgi:predicted phage tail protein
MTLSRREVKKRQMVRTGYGGLAVGAVLLVWGLTGGGILLDVIGAVMLVISGWATRALRALR